MFDVSDIAAAFKFKHKCCFHLSVENSCQCALKSIVDLRFTVACCISDVLCLVPGVCINDTLS